MAFGVYSSIDLGLAAQNCINWPELGVCVCLVFLGTRTVHISNFRCDFDLLFGKTINVICIIVRRVAVCHTAAQPHKGRQWQQMELATCGPFFAIFQKISISLLVVGRAQGEALALSAAAIKLYLTLKIFLANMPLTVASRCVCVCTCTCVCGK